MTKKHIDDQIWISLSDLWYLCRQKKRKIASWALIGAIFALFYVLTRPVEYVSKATFREKSNAEPTTSLNQSLTMVFGQAGNGSGNCKEAVSMLQSCCLLAQLIERMHLQGSLTKHELRFPVLANARDNLKTEWSCWNKVEGPIFTDPKPCAEIRNIKYDGEIPLGLEILFTDEHTFTVGESGKEIVKGITGEPVTVNNATFTLICLEPTEVISKQFDLLIHPIASVVERLKKQIQVEVDREDSSLLQLRCRNSDRFQSTLILNELMRVYEQYLRQEEKRVAYEQLRYLQERQDEMKISLRKMMDEHAVVLSADMVNLGFLNVNAAINFFSSMQQQYTSDLLVIELEIKRMQHAEKEGLKCLTYSSDAEEESVMKGARERLIKLEQQRDSIEVALSQDLLKAGEPIYSDAEIQLTHLSEVRKRKEENELLLLALENSQDFDSVNLALKSSLGKANIWVHTLQNAQTEDERQACMQQFQQYIKNMLHLLTVQENALQEDLTHQYNAPAEFHGIDLEMARDLNLSYGKRLHLVEEDIAERCYIIEQMKKPSFEITSLSPLLTDSVSQMMISNACKIVLALKDDSNRSSKEQERMQMELALQKRFLSEFLDQTVQLLELRHQILKQNIQALQITTLGLIQQEISILEKYIEDYIHSRITSLEQEKLLIESHQKQLQLEMAKLPKQWVSEKLIDQQMQLNTLMVEEITKMVETKNTSSNLDLVRSAPLDIAIVPTQPAPPRLLLFLCLGAAVGGFMAFSIVLFQTMGNKGMPVTAENLQLANYHVAGWLSSIDKIDSIKTLPDQDLETLRRLIVFLYPHNSERGLLKSDAKEKHGQTILLALSQTLDYSSALAQLLVKEGSKVILVSLSFDRSSTQWESGLLQYLEGQVELPNVLHVESYDFISSGGISRFGRELLSHSRFQALLRHLKESYDWILLVTDAFPQSSEVGCVLPLCNSLVITIKDHQWQEIQERLEQAADAIPPKRVSFLLTSENI